MRTDSLAGGRKQARGAAVVCSELLTFELGLRGADLGYFHRTLRSTTRLSVGCNAVSNASGREPRVEPVDCSRCISISHGLGCGRRSTAQKTLGRRTERRADRAPSRV